MLIGKALTVHPSWPLCVDELDIKVKQKLGNKLVRLDLLDNVSSFLQIAMLLTYQC